MMNDRNITSTEAALRGELTAAAARIWDWQQARGHPTARMTR